MLNNSLYNRQPVLNGSNLLAVLPLSLPKALEECTLHRNAAQDLCGNVLFHFLVPRIYPYIKGTLHPPTCKFVLPSNAGGGFVWMDDPVALPTNVFELEAVNFANFAKAPQALGSSLLRSGVEAAECGKFLV